MAEHIKIKRDISLYEIAPADWITRENSFDYAGIPGSAEMIGYKAILFRGKNSSVIDAIRLFDIKTEDEAKLCNLILKKTGFPLDFNSTPEDIFKTLGTDYSEEYILSDTVTYNYRLADDLFVSLEISDEKITGVQIICSREIIKNITEKN